MRLSFIGIERFIPNQSDPFGNPSLLSAPIYQREHLRENTNMRTAPGISPTRQPGDQVLFLRLKVTMPVRPRPKKTHVAGIVTGFAPVLSPSVMSHASSLPNGVIPLPTIVLPTVEMESAKLRYRPVTSTPSFIETSFMPCIPLLLFLLFLVKSQIFILFRWGK